MTRQPPKIKTPANPKRTRDEAIAHNRLRYDRRQARRAREADEKVARAAREKEEAAAWAESRRLASIEADRLRRERWAAEDKAAAERRAALAAERAAAPPVAPEVRPVRTGGRAHPVMLAMLLALAGGDR